MAREPKAAVDSASFRPLVRGDHGRTRVEMGPGELSFGNDQNTKPDAQGRRGHLSGTVGDKPCVVMMVQVEQVPVNNKPCQLK